MLNDQQIVAHFDLDEDDDDAVTAIANLQRLGFARGFEAHKLTEEEAEDLEADLIEAEGMMVLDPGSLHELYNRAVREGRASRAKGMSNIISAEEAYRRVLQAREDAWPGFVRAYPVAARPVASAPSAPPPSEPPPSEPPPSGPIEPLPAVAVAPSAPPEAKAKARTPRKKKETAAVQTELFKSNRRRG